MRSKLIVWLCAIFASVTFAATAMAQQIVRFAASSPHLSERVELNAELFKPTGAGPFPAVILMHGCGGWQPAVRYALQTHARILRDNGFVVLNIDSFGPRHVSGGRLCASDPDLYTAIGYRTDDAFDGLRYLQAQAFVSRDNVFLMGQSNGGAVAIRVAKSTRARGADGFRGIVAYYPWCGEFGGNRVALAAPLLILAGGKDDWVPARECEGVRSTGADLRVTVYPDAAHSFDLDILPQRFQGKLIGNDAHATRDSRQQMLAFFKAHLSERLKVARTEPQQRASVAQNSAPPLP